MPDIVQTALAFAREGFAEVNAIQGLVIALVATLLMTGWKRWLVFTAGAVIAHIAVDIFLPVFAHGAAFSLPPVLESHYWRYVGLLLVGYFVVIGILFAVKRVVIKR